MTNGAPPVDDISKSTIWDLTEAFKSKPWTREIAWKVMIELNTSFGMLQSYFANDNPNDVMRIRDYARLVKEANDVFKIPDEGEYLKKIKNVELRMYRILQSKYNELNPFVSEYVGSEVYSSLFPEGYDFYSMSDEEIDETVQALIEKMNEETSKKLQNFVVNAIKGDIYNNKNDIIFFVGPPGSGKSYGALSLASALDPSFNVDRVVFTVKAFMDIFMTEETDEKTNEKIQKFLPKGSVIVFDDAGLNINSRDWQTLSAKIMGKLAQSMRFLNHVIIFTVPNPNFIEKQTRSLVKFIFEAVDSQIDPGTGTIYKNTGRFKIFLQQFMKNGTILNKYPVITYNHRNIKLKYVTFSLAEKTLLDAYESKKKDFMTKEYEQFKKEINSNILQGINKTFTTVNKQKEEKKGIWLKCPSCGNIWEYKGKKTKGDAQCPVCLGRVDIEKNKLVGAKLNEK